VTTAAAPASDRLGSMAGSQATAGLRGGAVRVSGPRTAQMKPRAWPSFLCSARRPSSTAGREMRRSPRVQGCGGEAVLKSPGGDGCRTGDGGGLVGAEEAEVGLAPSFHGRLWLQGERQLEHPSRSTHGTPVRQPRLQAGRRLVGLASRRRRAPPVRLLGSPLLRLLLLPLFFSFLRWTGRNPHGRRRGTGS
jgi:hypothetical protein